MSKIIFGHPEFPAKAEEASMAERSFAREVEDLKLGAGQEFRGEGILAITKALLEGGVSYVAGYQGAPISHLMDVLSDAQDILSDLGVHFESSASEATAAATLAAAFGVGYATADTGQWISAATIWIAGGLIVFFGIAILLASLRRRRP
jgi:hypothetical protein